MKGWIFRLLVWTSVFTLSVTALALNKDLKSVDLSEKRILDLNWVATNQMDAQFFEMAKFAQVHRRPGYMDAFLYETFIPEKTRLQLGIQNLCGIREEVSPGEFACLVFGCSFLSNLKEMADSDIISENKREQISAEAKRFARSRKFWNCRSSCEH